MKRSLYGAYANELLVTLKDEIKDMQVEPVFYQITIQLQEGKWIIESVETEVSSEDLNSVHRIDTETETSTSSAAAD